MLAMPDTVSTTACTMLLMPLISPCIKSLPHWRAFPGRLVIKEIAPEKPFCTTDASPESAERMPETRFLKALTAASFNPVAIFTTVVLMPFQIFEAVFFSVFQICEMNWESAREDVLDALFQRICRIDRCLPDGVPDLRGCIPDIVSRY